MLQIKKKKRKKLKKNEIKWKTKDRKLYRRVHIAKCRNSNFGGKLLLQNAESLGQLETERIMTDSVFYQNVVCHWMTSPLYLYDNDIYMTIWPDTINTFQSIWPRFIIIILL